jgi:enoyl-[acyl-carrier protein] reductase / trans-2-enoyl-CoA reductase (NAD+)
MFSSHQHNNSIGGDLIMIVEPKIRGFICTTAHPAGCAQNVAEQVAYVKSKPSFAGTRRALIIGSSTGYGLASRIAAAFGCGADTIGVAFEKPAAGSRTATAGWYNTAAFQRLASHEGFYAKSIMGDAFSQETKQETIDLIKKDLGCVDLVVYSLAAPRRTTSSGETFSSVIKPVGADYSSKTVDMRTHMLATASVSAATKEEIDGTIKVMGGEDWRLWVSALLDAGVLDKGAVTLAYSYIGPQITDAIYTKGTIGLAKKDLEESARKITEMLTPVGGKAFISVNKAVVTQASSAIPAVPLYTSILFKVMKAKGIHEDCIEQMRRMLCEKLYVSSPVTDECGRIRLDDLELQSDVQKEVSRIWDAIDDSNLNDLADIDGYWNDFYRLFGFGINDVDYAADVAIDTEIDELV